MGHSSSPVNTPAKLIQWLLSNPNRYTGVGSRDAPEHVLELFRRLGKVMCDKGSIGSSGEADGCDKAFHDGARLSSRYTEVGFVAYLPFNGFRSRKDSARLYHNPAAGLWDATAFDSYTRAAEIAKAARGSWAGLGPGGIACHTRNTFQVLTPTLDAPSKRLFCWAVPVGKSGKVEGGTNTAVAIALAHNVPVLNCYYEHTQRKLEDWIREQDNKKAAL